MGFIFESAGIALLYGLVGFVVMLAGFVVLDLLTPGKLAAVVWTDRNKGAAVVLGGQMLGLGWVIAQAIGASESEAGLAEGLFSTFLYGAAGVVMMTLVFVMVAVLTPGRLGATVFDDEGGRPHPAAWVQATMYLGTALMIGAALT
ncbi:DUF350 domain-containing protein [Streptomyces sp. DSM 42041]|uniref:DUF350 domain-containing protein n=1 Tax=Streptomyces hazeniae TaxID=3075538 RepID=A0ABU2NTK7_9ACTN|nr:DUF350 domain-containing protein [Streptomyces sp. DSM 42041]MDT0380326.1 DUF350 domain-containing protein [Streptomyces sp. DSM 42041]